MIKTQVKIEIFENGKLPLYATECSAGCDVYATQDIVIEPGQTVLLPLNIKFALEAGVEAQVRPRSGLSLKTSLRIPNSPGTIDADYRDEVCVIATNDYSYFNMLQDLKKGIKDYKCVALEEYLGCDTNDLQKIGLAGQSVLINEQDGTMHGSIKIKKGDRIAQIVFAKYCQAHFIEVDNVTDDGLNRGGGFGHTGV